MLDCREQKTIEKLSEELEKAGYTHISFQVVHTKSRTTSVRGHKSVKKQDSEDAVYVIEAAHDRKKRKVLLDSSSGSRRFNYNAEREYGISG